MKVAAQAARPGLVWWDGPVAAFGTAVLALAWVEGLATQLVYLLLLAYVPWSIGTRVWAATRGSGLVVGFLRRPLAAEHRWLLAQVALRWSVIAVWVLVERLSLIPLQFDDGGRGVWLVLGVVLGVAALAPLVPKSRVLVGRNVLAAAVGLWFAIQVVRVSFPGAAAVTMDMPLRADVLVFHGGRSQLVNHHYPLGSQRDALDLDVVKDGKLGEGKDLTAYGCYGLPLYAPLDGTVALVVDDRPDVAIGETDREQIAGNHIALEVAPERFVFFAHLRHGSVRVRTGERVACGTVLAECGNSGNTSQPHLHLQVQNRADQRSSDLVTFPIAFKNVVVRRGSDTITAPLELQRNDRVAPAAVACR